jgi:hypothetical protein
VEREEAEQEELGVAKVMLSLAGAMRKAAKVAELAGVAESAKARPATQRWVAFLVCICQIVELIVATQFCSLLLDAMLRCRLRRW